jgi:hypothetical protein
MLKITQDRSSLFHEVIRGRLPQREPVARSTASTMSVTTASQASFFPGIYTNSSLLESS